MANLTAGATVSTLRDALAPYFTGMPQGVDPALMADFAEALDFKDLVVWH